MMSSKKVFPLKSPVFCAMFSEMFSTMHVIEGIFEVLDLAEHFCKKSEIDADDFVIQLSVKERADLGTKNIRIGIFVLFSLMT